MNTIRQLSPESKVILPEDLAVFRDEPYTIKPFDPLTLEFFNTISRAILSDKKLNTLPAFAALGFWLRKANMDQMVRQNAHIAQPQGFITEPRGIVFHVCPSNVDTMFVYSLAISLLTGNKNIVKLSGRLDNESITCLTGRINEVLNQPEFQVFHNYLAFISYAHDDEISGFFSLRADVRILWGGDQTINFFKSFPTKPRIRDIVFADRISCALFQSEEFLKLEKDRKQELSRKFFNDSYTFDQLGCSSPQMIFVLGRENDNRQFVKELYEYLDHFAAQLYTKDIYSLAGLKLNFLSENICEDQVSGIIYTGNYVVFAEAENSTGITKSCGAGFFYIKYLSELSQIVPLITRKIQTISYFGLNSEELTRMAALTFGRGIDRIVPVGQALNFDFIWDGYNLAEELCSRKRLI